MPSVKSKNQIPDLKALHALDRRLEAGGSHFAGTGAAQGSAAQPEAPSSTAEQDNASRDSATHVAAPRDAQEHGVAGQGGAVQDAAPQPVVPQAAPAQVAAEQPAVRRPKAGQGRVPAVAPVAPTHGDKVRVTGYVDPILAGAIKRIQVDEDRSESWVISRLIAEALERRGYGRGG